MVMLVIQKLGHSLKLFSKMENNHHHNPPPDVLSASLQAFRSHVSNCLRGASLNPDPGSGFLSLTWVQKCLELLPIVNKAFAKLVVNIDYPVSRWEAALVEEYLNYNLNLLELQNSISSSLSHLSQARLSLSHALSLVENSPSLASERLRRIEHENLGNGFKVDGAGNRAETLFSGKERVVHEALLAMRTTGLWICEVVLSGLCSNVIAHTGPRNSCGGFTDSCAEIEIAERGVVKEVKEVNEAVACLTGAITNEAGVDEAAKELERRLETLQKMLEGVGEESNCLFSEVLAIRNELLDSLRHRGQ